MDEKTRETLKAEFAALDKAESDLREARKPFDLAIEAIDTVRENLKDKHDIEIAGDCEGCSRLLFVCDKGFRYDDGPILCEACAPTFGDAEQNWKDQKPEDDEYPEHRKAFTEQMEAHIAAGGSRSDKLPLYDL